MNITLHSPLAKFVEDQVQSGRYATPDEVVNAALHVFQRQQDSRATSATQFRAEIQHGLDEANRGELEDWDADELRAEGQRLLGEARKKAV